MVLPRLIRSDRGATAIEYAIIGALIGIGLIGSLVTTKGSLSAIFGTASSQMGSASASGTLAPSLGQTLWGLKTLTSTSVIPTGGTRNPDGSLQGGQVQYQFAYSDGSFVEYTIQRDSSNNTTTSRIYMKNPAADPNAIYILQMDASGAQTYFERDNYSGGYSGTLVGYNTQNAAGSAMTNGSCTNGRCSAVGSSVPSSDFAAAAASVAGQVDYFRQLSAPLPVK